MAVADKVLPRAIWIPLGILLSDRSFALSWALPRQASRVSDCLSRCPWAGLVVITDKMIARFGAGTPAPWAPPRRLVVWGVVRHLRNLLISWLFCVLLADALAIQSLSMLAWTAVFIAANMICVPNVEGPGRGIARGSILVHDAVVVPDRQPAVNTVCRPHRDSKARFGNRRLNPACRRDR